MFQTSLRTLLQPVARMLRHSQEKTTFLASNCSRLQVCEIKYWPPSSLPFKVVPPSFEYGLVLLATLIRGGGGITSTRSWTGIYAKIRYSVSSTFATGCRTYKSVKYSETAPYGLAKTAIHFLLKKQPLVNTATPLIRPNFFGLLVTVLTGFHSIGKFSGVEFPSATLKFRIRQKNSLYCPRKLYVMAVLQCVQRQRKVLN